MYHHVPIKKDTLKLLNRVKAYLQNRDVNDRLTYDKTIYEALNYYLSVNIKGGENGNIYRPKSKRGDDTSRSYGKRITKA